MSRRRRRPAQRIDPADLGSYQQAMRRVLTADLITRTRPRPGVLAGVLRWADELTEDLRDLFGHTLIATTEHVRLVRELDVLDPTQRHVFSRGGRPFDRRRLAYLCLLLASFQRSQVEIGLSDLVRHFAPSANAIDGLGYDPTDGGHKAALVDVCSWLVEHGALHVSDGSIEAWAGGHGQADALFDIDHEVCEVLFRPSRPVQHVTGVAGLLTHHPDDPDRERTARRARRLLVELPVVHYADVTPDVAEALRTPGVAEEVAHLTGLTVERRVEGVLLADSGGLFTDRPFPGRGSAVNRTAGLLLAKIADRMETARAALTHLPVPAAPTAHAALVDRIDSALPREGVVEALAWTAPAPATAVPEPATAPLIEQGRLEAMVDDLFAEFGAASFTAAWQRDPRGLLDAALELLTDLSLLRPVPGGVLVLPAALRYRNIQGALPQRPDTGMLPLGLEPEGTP
ncbi:DUF2398 family protein [Nocardiopsis protaetiae]|uniref:DUF2398 family protein n=3 Tax=Nocardiopsis protaetiae TaxID=3382270 RepID=UPI00387B11A1